MLTPELGRVMVVDDEPELLKALCEILREQGYETMGFASGREALAALAQQDFDLLLTDLMMPEMDGIALLRAGLEIDPHLVGLVMTGQGTIQTAVEAMQAGAFDYVLKPFKARELLPVLSRAMGVRRLGLENVELRQTVAIYDLTAMVAFTLDLNLILDKTAEAAIQQCRADEVSVMLPAPGGDELYVAAVRGQGREHILGERLPIGQGIAGWVAQYQESLVLHEQVQDARFAPVKPRADIRTAASLPMAVGGEIVGVLNVNALRRRRPFTPGEMKALRLLSSIAASALESAQLYARVRESEDRFRRLAENAQDLIYRYRLQPTPGFEYISPAATAITGYSPQEHYADPELGFKIVYPEDRPVLEAMIQGQAPANTPLALRGVRKDGKVVWTEQRNVLIRDEAGHLVAIEGIARDITARKRQELEGQILLSLREEVWRMRAADDFGVVLTQVRDGLQALGVPFAECGVNVIDRTDPAPEVRSHNLTREGQWTTEESSQGKESIIRFWRSGMPAYRPDLHREDTYGERQPMESTFGRPVRSVLDVPFSHGTLAINSDQPNAFSEQDIAFVQRLCEVLSEGFRRLEDLQALEEKERQLHQAQKLESLGRLAGGVAHDFNNLITVIEGYGRMLVKHLAKDDPQRTHVEEILAAGERAEGLVRQLLAFSRRQPAVLQVVDLNTAVAGVEKMLRRLIGEDIELVTALAPEVGKVKADPGQVEQVLMNLAVNARDAMPEGGRLRIATVPVHLDEAQAADLGLKGSGPWAMLEVSDTGVGMDEATLSRIFEPFFTTKEEGRGTGLGLAVVYGIVRQHQGSIQVRSRPGEGTTLRIYLPASSSQELPALSPAEPAAEAGRGQETVLVVEDEGSVRQFLVRLLQDQGYAVLAAADGRQALQVAADHPQQIDLLLTDVVMPAMRGNELAQLLVVRHPGLKVLYMSGYHDLGELGGAGFLSKPFRPVAVLEAVHAALDQQG